MEAASFWSQNSCAPSWTGFLGQAWAGSPPNLLDTDAPPRRVLPPPGVKLSAGPHSLEVLQQVIEIWGRWFSISSSCRCVFPLTQLQENLKTGRWNLFVACRGEEVVGTLVRRWVPNVWIQGVKWNRVGVVDYFCIPPRWRKRGVSRALLGTLHNLTPNPKPPHLIFWEGLMPSIPPLATGVFWALHLKANPKALSGAATLWKQIPKSGLYSEHPGPEIWLGTSKGGPVAIWDTYHVSVPEGKRIGILLGTTDKEDTLEGLESPFGILLSSTRLSSVWTFDSVYQWIGYNLKHRSIQTQFPQIGF